MTFMNKNSIIWYIILNGCGLLQYQITFKSHFSTDNIFSVNLSKAKQNVAYFHNDVMCAVLRPCVSNKEPYLESACCTSSSLLDICCWRSDAWRLFSDNCSLRSLISDSNRLLIVSSSFLAFKEIK